MSNMGHQENNASYLGQLCQPFIQRTHTDQLCSGHWLIEADGRCGQMSVEFDQVRLADMGIKTTCNAASFCMTV